VYRYLLGFPLSLLSGVQTEAGLLDHMVIFFLRNRRTVSKHAHNSKKMGAVVVNTQILTSQIQNKSLKLPGLGCHVILDVTYSLGLRDKDHHFLVLAFRSQSPITHKLLMCISLKNIFTSILEGNRGHTEIHKTNLLNANIFMAFTSSFFFAVYLTKMFDH